MELTIEEPSITEIKEVYNIQHHFDNIFLQKKPFINYFITHLNNIRVVTSNNSLIGYGFFFRDSISKVTISSIWVKPSHRKKNIGSALLNSLENSALKLKTKYITIRLSEKNYPLSGFFIKNGYQTVGKINEYLRDMTMFPYEGNNETIIKEATLNDVSILSKIDETCFEDFWQISEKDFESIINSPELSIFIAFLNNKAVGYNYNSINFNIGMGSLIRLAVLPDHRRKHIATALAKNAFEYFSRMKVQKVYLSTYAESTVHNSIYTSWGFKKTGQEIILSKRLIS